jgi:DnaK suppressor protein
VGAGIELDLSMDRARLERDLEARRRELARELDRLTAVPSDGGGSVSFGKRIGDGTTEAVDRISTTAVARRLSRMAQEVDRALERLRSGSYGRCLKCRERIGSERLEALPWVPTCVSCAARDAAGGA